MGTASYKRLYRSVGAALHALDLSTYTAATPTINDRRRVSGVIRDRIVTADVFVQRLICMSAKNPHRVLFTDYCAAMADGDELPEHVGAIGEVVIKKYSAASTFAPAVEADSVEQILQWRENAGDVFGSIAHNAEGSALAGYFKQVGQRMRFTGHQLKAEIATITVPSESADPPTLYSPDVYEDVLFAHATSESLIEGDDMEELNRRREYVTICTPLILNGAAELPPFQQQQ